MVVVAFCGCRSGASQPATFVIGFFAAGRHWTGAPPAPPDAAPIPPTPLVAAPPPPEPGPLPVAAVPLTSGSAPQAATISATKNRSLVMSLRRILAHK